MRTLFRKNNYQVFLVDESRTNCKCSNCDGGVCEKFRVRKCPNKKKDKLRFSVFHYLESKEQTSTMFSSRFLFYLIRLFWLQIKHIVDLFHTDFIRVHEFSFIFFRKLEKLVVFLSSKRVKNKEIPCILLHFRDGSSYETLNCLSEHTHEALFQ